MHVPMRDCALVSSSFFVVIEFIPKLFDPL
jgi:hypothetical protein